jgi:RNA polymerase sigma-70 factor (ECF subfamily)
MNSTDQFEALVSEHYEPLYRFAMSLTRAESDARDLTQQTFYVWATKGHQLRDLSKVKTWLFTTLHRAFLQARRRQTRFTHHALEDVADELPVVFPMRFDQLDSSQVLLALARLDEAYQAPVALFYLEDCPYKDIAVILDVPMGTVKSRISRGIAQLRKILLSGDARDSTFNRADIPCISNSDEPATPPEYTRSYPLRSVKSAAASPTECGYDEWDFSSTLLLEPFGAS